MLRGIVMLGLLALGLAAAATPVTITVVDTAGQPVAGARVAIVQTEQRACIATAELRTDDQGICTADVQWSNTVVEAYDPRLVAVYKAGFALGGGSLAPGANTVTLQPPVTVTGSVVNERGQPVKGAKLAVYAIQIGADARGGVPVPEQWQSLFPLVTNAKGEWTFAAMPALAKYGVIRFADARFANAVTLFRYSPTILPVLLASRPTTLTGRVLAPDGTGVAGLYVNAVGEDDFGTAVTDATGAYRITSLRAGRYTVEVFDIYQRWSPAHLENITTTPKRHTAAPDILLTEMIGAFTRHGGRDG